MTTRTTFQFKFSRLFSKNRHLESFIVLFSTTTVRTLISVEGGEALSRSLLNINGILAKTRSTMTIAFTLSCQIDVGSRCALLGVPHGITEQVASAHAQTVHTTD